MDRNWNQNYRNNMCEDRRGRWFYWRCCCRRCRRPNPVLTSSSLPPFLPSTAVAYSPLMIRGSPAASCPYPSYSPSAPYHTSVPIAVYSYAPVTPCMPRVCYRVYCSSCNLPAITISVLVDAILSLQCLGASYMLYSPVTWTTCKTSHFLKSVRQYSRAI